MIVLDGFVMLMCLMACYHYSIIHYPPSGYDSSVNRMYSVLRSPERWNAFICKMHKIDLLPNCFTIDCFHFHNFTQFSWNLQNSIKEKDLVGKKTNNFSFKFERREKLCFTVFFYIKMNYCKFIRKVRKI